MAAKRAPSSILLSAAGLFWLAACLWFPLTDTDIWWHLASAKLMWARKAFLREDPFCLASLGAPWTDLHWGFQCLAYLAWKLGGSAALVAGKCLAVALALAAAMKPHLDRRTAPWLIPFAAFGIYHVRFFIDVRPLALTLMGLGIQYAVTMAWLRNGQGRPWRILIPILIPILILIQIALVNIQGLYPLGAVLVTCLTAGAWFDRRRDKDQSGKDKDWGRDGILGKLGVPNLRPLAITCAVMWAAGIASPYGWAGWKLPLALFGRIAPVAGNIFSLEIAENRPFLDLLRHQPGQALPFLFLGMAVLYSFDRARSRRSDPTYPRFSSGHLLLFAAFSALGCMAQRNLPLAFLAGLMAFGRNLQISLADAPSPLPAARGPLARGRPLALWAGWAAMAVIALMYAPKLRAAWEYELPGRMETPFRFPSAAADYLEAHPLPGGLFNELRYGGYLEFRLYPDQLTFVDGRMILRSPDFYRDFLAVVDHPEGFAGYRARYGLTHALLPISEDRRFLPLAASLLRHDGWTLLYCDGASALLADSTAARGMPVLSVAEAIHSRFAANPRLEAIASANAATFLEAAGLAARE